MALAPTSWWSREDVLSRSTCRRLSAYVTDGRWCILCWVCGWRPAILISSPDAVVVGGVSVLEFDRVSEDMLPRSDSFNDNGFASGKLLWRSEKLLISDGAASSSGVVVICLPSLWCSLWWCRRRRIDAGFLHRFILSFQFCKVCSFVTCNLFLSYE
jgi:hypothetical protein